MTPFDGTACRLGEGALWHPGRGSLFWFDILNRRMYERAPGAEAARIREFPDMVSAAGIVDDDRLLVASSRALLLVYLADGGSETLMPLEADNPATRSNDGRADPQGGFWIGTMGLSAQAGAGSIWRYWRGELLQIFGGITISNAICFSPDGSHACFADTREGIIRRVALDRDGWPLGDAAPFIDLRAEGLSPDGAVIDAEGALWSAQWGASRVARYDRDGRFMDAVALPASQISCPAFGGTDLTTLFATSALDGLAAPGPADGQTFAVPGAGRGQPEHRVIL